MLAPTNGRALRVQQKSAGVVQARTPLVEVGDAAAAEARLVLWGSNIITAPQGAGFRRATAGHCFGSTGASPA